MDDLHEVSVMSRFRFVAEYLQKVIPLIWWDAFLDAWEDIGAAMNPDEFEPEVDHSAFQHTPAVDFGGGD